MIIWWFHYIHAHNLSHTLFQLVKKFRPIYLSSNYYLGNDMKTPKYILLVNFMISSQWSPGNSCSVNPYVIFRKTVRDEIIREIDFFIWNVACRLRAVHFMMAIYNTVEGLIKRILFYLTIRRSCNKKEWLQHCVRKHPIFWWCAFLKFVEFKSCSK